VEFVSSMDRINNLPKTEKRMNRGTCGDGFTLKYALRSIPEG
jgi:hypothetical protein